MIGDNRTRTDNLIFAKHIFYQLKYIPLNNKCIGARTQDHRIKSPVLYQLSYTLDYLK
jgi:hypothetical protein